MSDSQFLTDSKFAFDAEGKLIFREQDLHIIVDGAFSAGKSSFIRAIATYPTSEDREIPLPTILHTDSDGQIQTIIDPALEALKGIKIKVFFGVGRIEIDADSVLYFHERPNRRYTYLLDWLQNRNLLGVIILADSAQPSTFRETRNLIETYWEHTSVPLVVAATKQNLDDALPADEIRQMLLFDDEDVPVIPCDSTQKESVKDVLLALLDKVIEAIDAPDEFDEAETSA